MQLETKAGQDEHERTLQIVFVVIDVDIKKSVTFLVEC